MKKCLLSYCKRDIPDNQLFCCDLHKEIFKKIQERIKEYGMAYYEYFKRNRY